MIHPTEHEMRILRYLDQHGSMHRETMVVDLASEGSRIASREGLTKSGKRFVNGSNGATPMIAANCCKRLIAADLVRFCRDREGFYSHHEITRAGRHFIRQAPSPSKREAK